MTTQIPTVSAVERERGPIDWAYLVKAALVFAGLGAGVIVLGSFLYGVHPPVRCADRDVEDTEMRPSDICITETRAGEEVERRTYDEVLADDRIFGLNQNEAFGVVIIILGSLIALFPLIAIGWNERQWVLEKRRQKERGAEPPPAPRYMSGGRKRRGPLP